SNQTEGRGGSGSSLINTIGEKRVQLNTFSLNTLEEAGVYCESLYLPCLKRSPSLGYKAGLYDSGLGYRKSPTDPLLWGSDASGVRVCLWLAPEELVKSGPTFLNLLQRQT
ncbi:hypothetical protein Z043_100309, partial [Scleropages formosus]